jgi:membrane-bound ClpP family serine protease
MESNMHTGAAAEHPEEHIHMPSPSFSPIILALGLACLVFGLAFGLVPIVIGAVLAVIGFGTWIYDDIKSGSTEHKQ